MAQRTSTQLRRQFYKLYQAGKTYAEIAAQFELSVKCVSNWCRRQQAGGSAESTYSRPPPGLLSRFHPLVRYGVLRLRLEHPRWGPVWIAVHLRKRPSLQGLALPCPAQIGRYLHQWPRFRRAVKPLKGRKLPEPVTAVHQCWQFDFKTGIGLRNGTQLNLHTVRDPFGAACLGAVVYATGQVGQAPKGNRLCEARATLRRCFARWGTLPARIQTDGETTLSAQRRWNDFPTRFTLWLVGLGVQHNIIRLGQPTDNAEVERCHRTVYEYAIVGHEDCQVDKLQGHLDQALEELLFELPSQAAGCHGLPPALAHPELLQPTRPFQPEQEWAQFDLQRVYAYLAQLTWQRKSSKTGQIFLGDQRYYVGRAYARRTITIRFDPEHHNLILLDQQMPEAEQEIRRVPIKGITAENLMGIQDPDFKPVPQQLSLPLVF